MNIFAVIPAAGAGQRALSDGADLPKQYRTIHSKTMLELTVAALLAEQRISQVYVAVSAGDPHIAGLDLPGQASVLETGGDTRFDTVRNTLQQLHDTGRMSDQDWVLVHDAARPGLPQQNLSALIDQCLQHNRPGLLAIPLADTLKRAQIHQESDEQSDSRLHLACATLDRASLWAAQTPQMFNARALLAYLIQAHEDNIAVTDEASAAEHSGVFPMLVQGSGRNFKVTWPEDFRLAAFLMEENT